MRRMEQLLLTLTTGLAVSLVAAAAYRWLDMPLTIWAGNRSAAWTGFWQIVTHAGESQWTLLVSAVIFFVAWLGMRRLRPARWALLVFVAVGGSGLLVNLLKVIFARYRPKAWFEHEQFGFVFFKAGYVVNSFPSGHACTAGALAMTLCMIWPRAAAAWIALGTLIAASRIFVTAHYLSDVLVGAWVGVFFALFARQMLRHFGLDAASSRMSSEQAGRHNATKL
ncbi:MAG: phosphatase PAP2 family protein [Phycisphaeraceae bacterium]|nr:phosphatase PAP2 family protein [Phycisphaeraceae bacterium]